MAGLSEGLAGAIHATKQATSADCDQIWSCSLAIYSRVCLRCLNREPETLTSGQVALYQVHWPFSFFMSQQTLMNALADEVKRGRSEAVGSNYSADQMREAHQLLADHGVRLAVNQVRYSLLSRQIETNGIFETAQAGCDWQHSPLAQGAHWQVPA